MADHPAFAALQPNDPTQLGPYRVLGRIGHGGMGTVFAAQGDASQLVAVKVINAHLADDERFTRHFRREVTAARQVRPFCTAPVLDAQLDEHPLFVVTEYIDGPTLHELVSGAGPLRGGALEQLAVGMAAALTAIHAAQVVHRDLKPSNVLLSPMGPRVIDFGIARALDGMSASVQPTQIAGTPGYMAPEVLRGEAVTPAADVFAWGCVLAYAASGTPPFPGDDVFAIHHRVMTEPPRLGGLDGRLGQLVERALDKDPGRRGSAAELLAQLVGEEAADAGRATEVLQRTWQARTWVMTGSGQAATPSRRGRHRPAVAVVAAAAAVCAALAGVLLWPEDDAHQGPDKDPAKVRSGPVTLHSAYSFELDTAPPAGAARWIDTRDATDDLRLLGRDGGAPDLMPGKPKALARWTSDKEPTEQQCLDTLDRQPLSRAEKVDRGDRMCLQTSDGRTAHVRIVSVPLGEGGTRLEATVWELPN
ncbi:serine/threonine protein kinase [Streptomyces bambusae]|uniref:serine/threonine-protein kinase n=1 Tax=Streptomyces bambusae TaxID=1550616 RepID=UPI001CFC5ABB|nr:serine/threonine-protein kinase [Streptomyces bambusae]MCB5167408.1 serine/threonine protein kinase [Streptomyces bambusae]